MSITFISQQRRCGVPHARGRLQRQRGVILIITLIILVAMTLASIAMIRSVDTATLIAGNVSFKQSAANSGDTGIEAAIDWLWANPDNLNASQPTVGYYAVSGDQADLTGNKTPEREDDNLEWIAAGESRKLGKDAAGNDISYVIHRLCTNEGPLDGGTCTTDQSEMDGATLGSERSGLCYCPADWPEVANRGYYRITVRVQGPKDSVGFVQAVISR